VYSSVSLGLKFLKYYLTASNGKGHGIHSPFVFEFITRILNDKKQYEAYDKVESLRKELARDTRMLRVEDFGAGSAYGEKQERRVKSILANAAKSKKYSQLLFRMVQYYQPATILELGTSLGITSSYLAMANPGSRLITLEGSEEIAGVAGENFSRLSLPGIRLVQGNFDDTLENVISGVEQIDFAFVDGNHREEPTIRYFEQLLKKGHNDTVLLLDDIHWSRGMEAAWGRIQSHTAVRCSIDLFFIGIVFFRKEFKEPVHYAIRF